MINKVAEMTRLAEVRGCMAAFHDAGLIKVASEEAFDNLCERVAENIGYDYDLQKIANVADAVITVDYQRQMQKTAGFLGTTAGKLKNALTLKGIRDVHARNVAAKNLLDRTRGKPVDPHVLDMDDYIALNDRLRPVAKLKNYGKAAIAPALAYGGLVGGGVAGKKLYDGYVGA